MYLAFPYEKYQNNSNILATAYKKIKDFALALAWVAQFQFFIYFVDQEN